MSSKNVSVFMLGVALGAVALPAYAQQASTATPAASSNSSSGNGVQEITVTAQRRSESANKVGLSIQAVSGNDLINRGVNSSADLVKIVPSLNIAQTALTVPVYTMRGVGFYDTALASTSTVSVYNDEVPLPYPAMTSGAPLDLARVEVLKGPQGTLYGSNSTGGAINYITAKPTPTLTAGGDVSFGRFARLDAQGFISGPLTDTLGFRIAAQTQQGGDWQYNYTRKDSIGAQNQSQGRVLLEWKPTSRLDVLINANGWYNKSDSQAPQSISYSPLESATPTTPKGIAQQAALISQPLAPANDRAADWPTNFPYGYQHNDWFYQLSARINYQLTNDISLTSLTAYDQLKVRAGVPTQGTTMEDESFYQVGGIKALTQELRLAGKTGKLHYIIGGNFLGSAIHDSYTSLFGDSSVNYTLGINSYYLDTYSRDRDYGAFTSLDYALTSHLKLEGGVRYTSSQRDFNGCLADSGDGLYAGLMNEVAPVEAALAGSPPPTVQAVKGGCLTLLANDGYNPGRYYDTLTQHNVSWRGGLDWTLPQGTLVYANISRGYKQGSFPTISAMTSVQFAPVTQESLLAYEVGFKAPLFDRKLQLNGAFFYYDYTNKQVLGRIFDPVLQSLQRLTNIPKSHIIGGELEISARPFPGLTLNGAVTYLHSRVDGSFIDYDNYAIAPRQFAGESFPFTPNLSGNLDAQYDFGDNGRRKFFVGSSLTYNGPTYSELGDLPEEYIKAYALLDLRAGIAASNNRWRVSIWGKNVTNTYYWSNAYRYIDYFTRLTGQPATYGASVSFRY